MAVDVASLVVAIRGDTAGLAASLAQAEAATRQFAATASAGAGEATAAMQQYDKTVQQTVTNVQKLGDETVRTIVSTRQHGDAVTQTTSTITKLGDEVTRTTVTVREGEAAVQSLTSRWLAFANLGSLLNLPGAGLASQIGLVGQGLEGAAGSSGKLQAALDKIGPAGVAMGVAAAGGVALVAAAIVDATTKAAAWEATLVRIQNNTGLSNAQTGQLSASSLALAGQTGASPEAIATAQEHAMNIVKNPVAAQAITQMATESAYSMGYDPVATTTMLAQVMHEYGYDRSDAATPQAQLQDILGKANEIMGQLHIAVQQSGVEQGPFADALARPLGVGANAGFSPSDVMAALATATLHGYPDVANAGTQVQSLESHMLAPTPKSQAALQRLANLSGDQAIAGAFDPGNLAAHGFVGTIDDIKAAMEQSHLSEPDQNALAAQIVPALRGGQLFQALLGTGNADLNNISQKTGDVTEKNTLAVDALTKTLDTTVGQWNLLKARLDTSLIAGGSAPNRAAGQFLGAVNDSADALGLIGGIVGTVLGSVGRQGIIGTVQAIAAPRPAYQGDPAQIAADHAVGLQSSTGLAAAQATDTLTRSMQDQARQAKETASGVDTMVTQTAQRHADLSAQLAATKAQHAGVIDPMQARVSAAQQSYDEASLQAQVGTDQVHDQYDGPIKAAQAALTAFQRQHQQASAQFAQEAADAHAAHDGTIHQLEQQLQLMTDQNKYQREAVQLTDQIAQNQASIALQAAEGDPAKRAALEGTIAAAQARGAVAADHERVQQLTYQLARTPDNARNHDRYVQGQAQLAEAQAKLAEDSLVNPDALGGATAAGKLAASKASADSANAAIATARTQLAEIPLQQRLDGEKKTLQDQLDTIQKQKDAEDAMYNKTLPGLQSALDSVKQKEQDALGVITSQLRVKQEQVDRIKADLIPQIDAQTAAEKLAVDQIDAQLTQVGLVEQAWKDAKADVDAYNKALTSGGPDAALAEARKQWAAQVQAEAGMQGPDYHGLAGAVGGQAGPNPPGTISDVAGASRTVAAIAQARLGERLIDYCEKFVEQVTGTTGTPFQTAVAAAAAKNLTGGNPLDAPTGAELYYANTDAQGHILSAYQDAQGRWHNAGHAAIKEAGDLQIGSDDNGVSRETISTWAKRNHQFYLGYAVPKTAGDYGHGGGSNGGGGNGCVYITVADGAIRVEGGDAGNAPQQARLIHDSLMQLARDVAATITPGAPRNVPGNVRA